MTSVTTKTTYLKPPFHKQIKLKHNVHENSIVEKKQKNKKKQKITHPKNSFFRKVSTKLCEMFVRLNLTSIAWQTSSLP